jgi:hypothetical protein
MFVGTEFGFLLCGSDTGTASRRFELLAGPISPFVRAAGRVDRSA